MSRKVPCGCVGLVFQECTSVLPSALPPWRCCLLWYTLSSSMVCPRWSWPLSLCQLLSSGWLCCSQAHLTSHQLTSMNHFAMVFWSVTLLSPIMLTHISAYPFCSSAFRAFWLASAPSLPQLFMSSGALWLISIKRSFLRFSVVLLCINILIVLTNIVSTVAFILSTGADVTVLVWLSLLIYVALFLPAVVVPVLMMVLFKPILSAVKGLLMCRSCRARAYSETRAGQDKEARLLRPAQQWTQNLRCNFAQLC